MMKIKYLLVATGMLIGLSLIAVGITGGRMTLAEASDIYHGKKTLSEVFDSESGERLWTYQQDPEFSNTQLPCEKSYAILEFIEKGLIGIDLEKPLRAQFNYHPLSKKEADFLADYYSVKVSRVNQKPYVDIKELEKNCTEQLITLGNYLHKMLTGKNRTQLSGFINKYYLPNDDEVSVLPRFKFIYNEDGILIDFAIRSKQQMIQNLRTSV